MNVERVKLELAYMLVKLRDSKGLTQDQLERTSGIGKTALTYYERAEYLPNLTNFCKLARTLGEDPGKLLTEVLRRAGDENLAPLLPLPPLVRKRPGRPRKVKKEVA